MGKLSSCFFRLTVDRDVSSESFRERCCWDFVEDFFARIDTIVKQKSPC
jgi:hypothetical protein